MAGAAEVLAEVKGAVGIVHKVAPLEFHVVGRRVGPGEGCAAHVRFVSVMWALTLGTVLLVGLRCQGARQLGIDAVVLQLRRQFMLVVQVIAGVQDQVIHFGIGVIAKSVATLDVGLELQVELVGRPAADTVIGIGKDIAGLFRNGHPLTKGLGGFRRNRFGDEIHHAAHVVGAVMNGGAAPDNIHDFQARKCNREKRHADVAVGADGNRVTVQQNLKPFTAQRVQTTHTDVGKDARASFIKHREPRNRAQGVVQIQRSGRLELILLHHRAGPCIGLLGLFGRWTKPVSGNIEAG